MNRLLPPTAQARFSKTHRQPGCPQKEKPAGREPGGGAISYPLQNWGGCAALKTFLERARIHGRFRDAAAKLEWAKRRIQELDLQSTEYLRSHWVFYERRSTGPLHERLLSIRYTKPVPLRFGLMIGDVANNLRSALDHMVWEVVGPYKPKNAKAVQFPFAERPQDLSKKIKTHFIYLAGPEAERIVGLHQGDLFGLDQLNNKDKHRLITVLGDVAEIRGLKGEEGNPHKPYVRFEGLNMSHAPGDVRDLMLGGFGAGRI